MPKREVRRVVAKRGGVRPRPKQNVGTGGSGVKPEHKPERKAPAGPSGVPKPPVPAEDTRRVSPS
jgi:hypothetical protein